MVYWIGYFFFHIFRLIWFPCKIIGKENLPKKGAFIFASNHASNLDPFLLGIIPTREIYFFAKKELFKNPIIGWLMREWHAFPADRDRADIGAFKTSIRYLRKGSPLVFFPQGTRNRPDQKGRVFSGIGFLVSKANVPVVPAYIVGSDKCMPPGSKFPRRHWITIVIGKPIFFSETSSYEGISQEVMAQIQALRPF
jgi:1-acyl-sn-glycerol-3-phosphate acyltransferase